MKPIFIQLFITLAIGLPVLAQKDSSLNQEKLRGYYSFSGGINTFPGYCVGFEFGLTKKFNNIILAFNYNAEYGNKAPGFLTKNVYYNDNFFEIALNYGRMFKKNNFSFHVDGGPGMFIYTDKSLGKSEGYLTTNTPIANRKTSIGLSVQTGFDYYFTKKIACGLKINTNLNTYYNIFGVHGRFLIFMN